MYKLEHLKGYSKHGEHGGKGWYRSVMNSYKELENILYKNPSLKHETVANSKDILEEAWKEAYRSIRDLIYIIKKRKDYNRKRTQ